MTRIAIVFSILILAAACSGDDGGSGGPDGGGPETGRICNATDRSCNCRETNEEPDEPCHADLWTNGFCCDSDEACLCREAACRQSSATLCTCANTLVFDPGDTFVGACSPPVGGRCCLEPGTIGGARCVCADRTCLGTEVASCSPADIMDCGAAATSTDTCE